MPAAFDRFLLKLNPLVVGGLLVALWWVADCLMDALVFGERAFFSQLFAPSKHELAIRLLASCILGLFIFYAWALFRKRNQLDNSLEVALRQSATEKAKTTSLLEAFDDQISIQDTDFKILYQNTAHKQAMGDHQGEYCYAAYQNRQDICPGCHLAKSFSDGRPHRRETRAVTKQGERVVEITASPVKDSDGEIVAGIEVVRDITERKKSEKKIRELNQELKRRASELSNSNEELKTFGYSLCHDLKSPLTQMFTATQILRESNSQASEDLVEMIYQGCQRMEEMIEAMMLLARISTEELDKERIDISAMVQDIIAGLQLQNPERQASFEVDPNMSAVGDPMMIQLVFQNLLENAWKFTRKVAMTHIEVKQVERQGRQVIFVRDNGAGFDPKKAPDLFTPFKRLHPKSEFSGSGIGLATVQRIIQRHHGEIWAESQPGAGATFYISLPGQASEQ